MSRDHTQLKVFTMADDLVPMIYDASASFPMQERFGLQSQIRRASVSVPTNIVEGCARRTSGEYVHFLNIALASAAEVNYLVGLSRRLGFMSVENHDLLSPRCSDLCRALGALVRSIS